MKSFLIAALSLAIAACANAPMPMPPADPLVLTGQITRADHQSYREIPFSVPPGTQRITIDFAYTGQDQRTVIDIGVRDPGGQRGWSGGNKSHIVIGEWSATPSYRRSPIQPGTWSLVLGIPNIRNGQTATYEARISLSADPTQRDDGQVPSPFMPPTSSAGWLRGDFHTHTAHSDGSCDVGGTRRPCPLRQTVLAARGAGLAFVAITDHNTIAQLEDILVQQDARTLLIPGTEITTFNGHANVIGNTDFLDFQLGSPRLPTLATLFEQVEKANAFISVNHPSLPSGEACMGCGWTVKDTDWSRVTAIEVINGASMRTSGPEGAFNGIAFWESRLKEGHRITAIAGSDNHDATDTTGVRQSPVGTPATVVHASKFSTEGIIAGVTSGRVFIDVVGLPTATLDLLVRAGDREARMGGEIALGTGEDASLHVEALNLPAGSRIEAVAHNVTAIAEQLPFAPPPSFRISLLGSARSGWVRFNIRDASGKLLLLSNPVYFRSAG